MRVTAALRRTGVLAFGVGVAIALSSGVAMADGDDSPSDNPARSSSESPGTKESSEAPSTSSPGDTTAPAADSSSDSTASDDASEDTETPVGTVQAQTNTGTLTTADESDTPSEPVVSTDRTNTNTDTGSDSDTGSEPVVDGFERHDSTPPVESPAADPRDMSDVNAQQTVVTLDDANSPNADNTGTTAARTALMAMTPTATTPSTASGPTSPLAVVATIVTRVASIFGIDLLSPTPPWNAPPPLDDLLEYAWVASRRLLGLDLLQSGASDGFDIVNLSDAPIQLWRYIDGDSVVSGPPVGDTVIQPGGYIHVEIKKDFLSYWATLDFQDLGPNPITVFSAHLTSHPAAATCLHGSGRDCGVVNGNTVLFTSASTSTIDVVGTSQRAIDIMKAACTGSYASCSFVAKKQENVLGPLRGFGDKYSNTGPTVESHNISYDATVQESSLVEGSVKVGVKFTDMINAEIKAKYGRTWTTTHSYDETYATLVPPGTSVKLMRQEALLRVTGDMTIVAANTTFVLRGVYFDTPDPDGQARIFAIQGPPDPTGAVVPATGDDFPPPTDSSPPGSTDDQQVQVVELPQSGTTTYTPTDPGPVDPAEYPDSIDLDTLDLDEAVPTTGQVIIGPDGTVIPVGMSTSAPPRLGLIETVVRQVAGALGIQMPPIIVNQPRFQPIRDLVEWGVTTVRQLLGFGALQDSAERFDVVNLTKYPISVYSYSGQVRGPGTDVVVRPGQAATFYVGAGAAATSVQVIMQNTPGLGSPRRAFAITMTTRDGPPGGPGQTSCSTDAGASCAVVQPAERMIVLNEAAKDGDPIHFYPGQESAAAELLASACGAGSYAQCKFTAKGSEIETLGPVKYVGKKYNNHTTQTQSETVAFTDTVSQSDSFEISTELGVKFMTMINTEISAKYQHSWTATTKYSESYPTTIEPNSAKWLERRQAVLRATGDLTVTVGNTVYIVHDMYFDTPNPAGQSSMVRKTSTIPDPIPAAAVASTA